MDCFRSGSAVNAFCDAACTSSSVRLDTKFSSRGLHTKNMKHMLGCDWHTRALRSAYRAVILYAYWSLYRMILQMEFHLQHFMGSLEEENSGIDKNAIGKHFVTHSYNSVNLKFACSQLQAKHITHQPKPKTHNCLCINCMKLFTNHKVNLFLNRLQCCMELLQGKNFGYFVTHSYGL